MPALTVLGMHLFGMIINEVPQIIFTSIPECVFSKSASLFDQSVKRGSWDTAQLMKLQLGWALDLSLLLPPL